MHSEPCAVGVLRDPVILSRFLFVLPLLAIAEIVVARGLGVQARQFLISGVVPAEEAIKLRRQRPKRSPPRVGRRRGGDRGLGRGDRDHRAGGGPVRSGESTWKRTGAGITLAGWWYILVSLPILFFFLLRWFWIFLLWSRFLFHISRLGLELTPTHPTAPGAWDSWVGAWRASAWS